MLSKVHHITELAKNTLKELSSAKRWMAFLNSAAWQYKYSFEDQVLIFAQRPDAKACADFDTWNEKLGRKINRGAKGIALLREEGDRYYLDHVFDISDTNIGVRGVDIRLLLNKGKQKGVDLKDIQAWLGHSDFSTTANIYSHIDATSKANSLRTLEDIVSI